MFEQWSLTELAAELVAAEKSRKAATAMAKGSQKASKAGRKPSKKCRRQLVQCQDFVTIACATQVEAEQCRQLGFPCCEPLATCEATSMLECLLPL